ncbi:Uncharacterised protein [Candidatus Bartonella washoeensis]|uniref:VirB5 n=1 Tax=Candidatus Bartonella washoeensis Sb944nv TaxID=1094563 RepID=J1J405_9HYPH|nr:hypothetical protein [Bartonella washoeensis]EJF78867.1 hypothetical protein MCQ_01246 [Bartonella washoeensis Sb944nv]SPU27879.1 Uncharacterised protein [Bartonella washoeensis]
MKKYGLITLLSLSCISHATAQNSLDVEEYYQKALENTQKLDAAKSETAETIYKSAAEMTKKIDDINSKLATVKANQNSKPEDFEALQVELSILQARLLSDTLKLESLAMIQARDTKTKEELREEQVQQQHKEFEKKLKEKLEKTSTGLEN